jgi:glucan phosphoethanolaminetransferase (alkaline phosphatase superfamily)
MIKCKSFIGDLFPLISSGFYGFGGWWLFSILLSDNENLIDDPVNIFRILLIIFSFFCMYLALKKILFVYKLLAVFLIICSVFYIFVFSPIDESGMSIQHKLFNLLSLTIISLLYYFLLRKFEKIAVVH